MPHSSPIGAYYVQTDGANSYITITDAMQFKPGAKGEMTLECAFVDWPAGSACIFGSVTGQGVGLFLNMSNAGIVSFGTSRVGGTNLVTATTALVRGLPYVLHGVDDGSKVRLYVDGIEVGTAANSKTGLLSKDTGGLTIAGLIGFASSFAKMKVYGFGLRLDDDVVGRWRVVRNGGAVIPDRTNYGNDAAIIGTEGTQYVYGHAWQPEPPFPGKVSL